MDGKMSEHTNMSKNQEGFFQKLKQSHYLMGLVCIVLIAVLFLGSDYFGWKSSNLLLLAFFAACMFGHMLMMKNHNH